MHKREILKWRVMVEQRGYTIIPLKLYLVDNRAKVEIGLARGKRAYDKREAIAERDSDRDIERAMKAALR